MAAPQVKDDFEEDEGPSVDSQILEERIAARRIRIAQRLEAMKQEALGDLVKTKVSSEPEKELSKSRKQIEESYQRLAKLISDGEELVSNIEVACDSRESTLRFDEDQNSKERKKKLSDEVKTASEKFEQITKKWEGAVKKDIPQELQKILLTQKESCNEMIQEKDKLIDELQQDLKQKDDQYVKDLRKQAEDADLIIERMEEQMKTLYQAYKEELDAIEESFYSERKDLLRQQKNKWNQQTESRRQREMDYMELRLKHVEDYEEQLKSLRVQDAEEYNMVKIKLETDVQILEQNLQQMKATYQLNQEKLEYNFQVLKKRDEENTITKSQQKRKITRLQDLLNNLKQKLKKQELQYSNENQTFTDDLKRMTEQYKELQKKFRHFQATDNKKFGDVWKMNEEQVKDLITDVLAEDKIIYEQQLGLDWETPHLEFLTNIGPIRTNAKKDFKTALDVAQEIMSENSNVSLGEHGSNESRQISSIDSTKTQDSQLSTGAVKKMLELLCDESGFLVEAKLIKLLAPIEQDERSLMKLDAIFNAIGIETESDIMLLAKYLFKQTHNISLESSNDILPNEDSGDTVKSTPATAIKSELIHPNDVTKALRQFVEDNREPFRESRKSSAFFGVIAKRDSSHDDEYWRQLASVIDTKKERVWDAIISGFEKYSHVLKERSTLILETDSLRQQNSELRMLLHQYLSSKVNMELEVPPTRVLQLEVKK